MIYVTLHIIRKITVVSVAMYQLWPTSKGNQIVGRVYVGVAWTGSICNTCLQNPYSLTTNMLKAY